MIRKVFSLSPYLVWISKKSSYFLFYLCIRIFDITRILYSYHIVLSGTIQLNNVAWLLASIHVNIRFLSHRLLILKAFVENPFPTKFTYPFTARLLGLGKGFMIIFFKMCIAHT